MTWFDATRVAIDVSDAETNAPPRLEGARISTGGIRLRIDVSRTARNGRALRDAAERHDGQIRPAAEALHLEFEHSTRLPTDERVWRSAGRSSRPAWPRLESWSPARGKCLKEASFAGFSPDYRGSAEAWQFQPF